MGDVRFLGSSSHIQSCRTRVQRVFSGGFRARGRALGFQCAGRGVVAFVAMSTTNRLNVVPTVTVLAVIKNRLAGAQKGYKLLKKKADALTMRYRQILTKIVAAKQRMGATMKASAFALTEAKYIAGEGIKHTVLDAVEQANVRVRAHTDNVAGVKLPRFEHYLEGAEAKSDMTGLGGGGKQLQNCKRAYLGAVPPGEPSQGSPPVP